MVDLNLVTGRDVSLGAGIARQHENPPKRTTDVISKVIFIFNLLTPVSNEN